MGFYPIKRNAARKRLTDFKKKSECKKTIMRITSHKLEQAPALQMLAPLISRLIVNEAPLFRADTKTETKES
jgi:hypothetical protein